MARLLSLIERLEKDLTRAGELRDQQKTLEAQAALASTLAQHLRANELLAYIQEEALRRLAEDGSRHLEALSQRRYSLVVEEQEFAVVDHWNADRQRSVKTLSGGETFLASLALALALAEGLAGLAAEGHAGEALESLFLDEGFGTLDPETLGQVIQALDALHGGERMVGVVTHIPELAAQLPARVEVRRGEGPRPSPSPEAASLRPLNPSVQALVRRTGGALRRGGGAPIPPTGRKRPGARPAPVARGGR